ncbi:MAG: hypothetical protein M5R36_07185 [Deltaproteobacteria bacterium]|nr:hypothetical protein [Deltaproteobacteria bacterium]
MPQLLLILLVALSVVLDACAGDDGDDAPGAFKRSAYDEPLDCDAEGDGPDAKACQLAYYANRERRGHPEESDGAAPLDWDEELARVAREYCASMCEENF